MTYYRKLIRAALFLISLLILFLLVIYSNPLVLLNTIGGSNYNFILVGLIFSFGSIMLSVLKWKVLLKNVSYKDVFPVQLLGLAVSNFTPGKAAEPVKAIILKARKGVDVSTSLSSIVWERIMDVIVLLLFSFVAIGAVSINSSFYITGVLSMVIFSLIILVSFSVLYSKRFGNMIFNFLRKFPILKRLPENFMEMFYKSKIPKRKIIYSFFSSLLAWVLVGFVLYGVLLAFGVSVNPIVLTGIAALAIVIGIASSLPGGLGTTEAVLIFLLNSLGIENSIAVAAAFVFRFLTFWFVNLIGGISFLYLSKKFKIKLSG